MTTREKFLKLEYLFISQGDAEGHGALKINHRVLTIVQSGALVYSFIDFSRSLMAQYLLEVDQLFMINGTEKELDEAIKELGIK